MKLFGVPRRPALRAKDSWDKAGVIAQYLSGVVVAVVGLIFTTSNNNAQREASETNALAQLEVSNRQQTATYVNQIVSQKEVAPRAELVGALDLSLKPEDAIPIAIRYARPDQDPAVVAQAIKVLQRLKNSGRATLREIENSSAMPDASIAEAILGENIHIKVRISQIDDFGALYINVANQEAHHRQISPSMQYGQDSGWMDITGQLVPGVQNLLLFKVFNGPYGGSSGRLEISDGTQQYDSHIVRLPGCPCDADAFFILAHLVVYDKLSGDGSVGLSVGEPETYPWPGKQIPH
jgi:hypothetical protein